MALVQVNDVVNAVLELVRPIIKSEVRIKTDVSHSLPAVQADSSRLEQVLLNLILNALDAMPDGGELAVCAELVSGDAVSDGNNEAKGGSSLLPWPIPGSASLRTFYPASSNPFLRPSRLAWALASDCRARN